MLADEQVERRIASGESRSRRSPSCAPYAQRRFIILDEAQNTTPLQMKMFLNPASECKPDGDLRRPNQVDLPDPGKSGLADSVAKLEGIRSIAMSLHLRRRRPPPAGRPHRRGV